MAELMLLIAALIGLWLFKSSKAKRYPNRLLELEQALQTQADLRLHRNKDAETSCQLAKLAEDLKRAQYLLNEGSESVRSNWPRLRPQMLHLTSEEILTRVDLLAASSLKCNTSLRVRCCDGRTTNNVQATQA